MTTGYACFAIGVATSGAAWNVQRGKWLDATLSAVFALILLVTMTTPETWGF
jgi:hypothetical protein